MFPFLAEVADAPSDGEDIPMSAANYDLVGVTDYRIIGDEGRS
jgi:hypothetical protein